MRYTVEVLSYEYDINFKQKSKDTFCKTTFVTTSNSTKNAIKKVTTLIWKNAFAGYWIHSMTCNDVTLTAEDLRKLIQKQRRNQ